MAVVGMNYLLEAGVHFGHQTKRWNPKMKEYIFTSRDDIYIIDLEKTVACIERAYEEIKKIAENGGSFLFVGTKKQAVEASIEEATRSESFYVTERWLGGTLTNFRTIRKRIRRLDEIENMEKNGMFEVLPKKEVIGLKKEYEKLNKVLCGVRAMEKLPNALIIVDPKKEINAIREARKLNIPVVGLIDTNCNPEDVDYVIPGNDDAIRSVKLIATVMANAVIEGKQGESFEPEMAEEQEAVEEAKTESRAPEESAPTETELKAAKRAVAGQEKTRMEAEVTPEARKVRRAKAQAAYAQSSCTGISAGSPSISIDIKIM